MNINDICGALARGYCTERNSKKQVDADLIMDMAEEVKMLFRHSEDGDEQAPSATVDEIVKRLIEIHDSNEWESYEEYEKAMRVIVNEIIHSQQPTTEDKAKKFIELLVKGGSIVSSNDCSDMEMAFASACGRFLVIDYYGYVYRPKPNQKKQTNTGDTKMIGKTETSEPVGSTAINDVNRIKQLIESAQLDNSQDVRDSITELLNNIESYLILAEKRMDKLEVDQKLSEQLNNEIQELSKMLFATRIEDVERIRAIGNKLINMVA